LEVKGKLFDQTLRIQSNQLLTNDIIAPAIDFASTFTDANIDESCNRTHHESNWLACAGKSILAF